MQVMIDVEADAKAGVEADAKADVEAGPIAERLSDDQALG
jgi:hypothetical protein